MAATYGAGKAANGGAKSAALYASGAAGARIAGFAFVLTTTTAKSTTIAIYKRKYYKKLEFSNNKFTTILNK